MKLGPYFRDVVWEYAYFDSLVRYAFHDRALGRAMVNGVPPAVMLFLFSYSVIVLLLRMLSPRPPAAELARQPGLWACAGAVFGVAVMLVSRCFVPVFIPASVALAWLGLAASGAWRREALVDRSGRQGARRLLACDAPAVPLLRLDRLAACRRVAREVAQVPNPDAAIRAGMWCRSGPPRPLCAR